MRAGGDGDLWRESKSLTTEDTEEPCQPALGFSSVFLCDLCGKGISMAVIQDSPSGATFAVKVHPRAKKNAITGEVGDALKVALTAPPADGKANAACAEFLAKLLNVPQSSVTIASGQTRRYKVIRVAGVTAQQVRDGLGM